VAGFPAHSVFRASTRPARSRLVAGYRARWAQAAHARRDRDHRASHFARWLPLRRCGPGFAALPLSPEQQGRAGRPAARHFGGESRRTTHSLGRRRTRNLRLPFRRTANTDLQDRPDHREARSGEGISTGEPFGRVLSSRFGAFRGLPHGSVWLPADHVRVVLGGWFEIGGVRSSTSGIASGRLAHPPLDTARRGSRQNTGMPVATG
jgi:hypothetical protein